jgi:hypothetical protein
MSWLIKANALDEFSDPTVAGQELGWSKPVSEADLLSEGFTKININAYVQEETLVLEANGKWSVIGFR